MLPSIGFVLSFIRDWTLVGVSVTVGGVCFKLTSRTLLISRSPEDGSGVESNSLVVAGSSTS